MNPRNLNEYYQSLGQTLPSVQDRQTVAADAGIANYRGTASQNAQLLQYLQSQNTPQSTPSTEINLSTVQQGVIPVESVIPPAQPIPSVPIAQNISPINVSPEIQYEQGLVDQIGVLQNELSTIENRMLGRTTQRNADLETAGVFDDMRRASQLRSELQRLQDRNIEIPIETRQDLRGRGATRTEFAQTTTPQLERNALSSLATSRNLQAVNDIIATNTAIVDSRINAERERDEFIYQSRQRELETVQQTYSNLLSDRQKQKLEEAKFANELYKISFEADLKARQEAMKTLTEKGVSFNTNMDLNQLTGLIANKNKEEINDAELYQKDSISNNITNLEWLISPENARALSANVGPNIFARGASLLDMGGAQDWRTKLKNIVANETFNKLGQITQETSLGAISEGELKLVQEAANELALTDSGRVKMTEKRFNEIITTLSNAQKKMYLRLEVGDVVNVGTPNNPQYIPIRDISDTNTLNSLYKAAQIATSNRVVQRANQNTQQTPSQNLITSFIKREEGFSTTAYRDGKGYSIGYGNQTHPDGTPVRAGDRIDTSQADQYLQAALNTHSRWRNLIKVPLTPQQQAAIASFEYNLGSGVWNGNKARQIIASINRGVFNTAANLMQNFNRANGQVNKVLVARRQREGQLLNNLG